MASRPKQRPKVGRRPRPLPSRARVHSTGIWLCQRIFGVTLDVPKQRSTVQVPVRLIAEQHVLEDLGWIPSPADYINGMPIRPWMSGAQRKTIPLSHLLLNQPSGDAQ